MHVCSFQLLQHLMRPSSNKYCNDLCGLLSFHQGLWGSVKADGKAPLDVAGGREGRGLGVLGGGPREAAVAAGAAGNHGPGPGGRPGRRLEGALVRGGRDGAGVLERLARRLEREGEGEGGSGRAADVLLRVLAWRDAPSVLEMMTAEGCDPRMAALCNQFASSSASSSGGSDAVASSLFALTSFLGGSSAEFLDDAVVRLRGANWDLPTAVEAALRDRGISHRRRQQQQQQQPGGSDPYSYSPGAMGATPTPPSSTYFGGSPGSNKRSQSASGKSSTPVGAASAAARSRRFTSPCPNGPPNSPQQPPKPQHHHHHHQQQQHKSPLHRNNSEPISKKHDAAAAAAASSSGSCSPRSSPSIRRTQEDLDAAARAAVPPTYTAWNPSDRPSSAYSFTGRSIPAERSRGGSMGAYSYQARKPSGAAWGRSSFMARRTSSADGAARRSQTSPPASPRAAATTPRGTAPAPSSRPSAAMQRRIRERAAEVKEMLRARHSAEEQKARLREKEKKKLVAVESSFDLVQVLTLLGFRCDKSTVKKTFRAAMIDLHPDKVAQGGSASMEEAVRKEEMFKILMSKRALLDK